MMSTLGKDVPLTLSPIIAKAHAHVKPVHVDIVYYHAGCSDGFAARWVVESKLGELCDYRPFYYYNPPDFGDLRNKTVLFLDCALKPKALRSLQNDYGATTLVLDHHQSAKDAFHNIPVDGVFIDTTRCAAVLAWQYVYGTTKPMPRFLRYIEDRDLWRWNHTDCLPESRPFTAAFMTLVSFKFDAYNKCLSDAYCNTLVQQGKLLMAYQEKRVQTLVKHASRRTFWGHTVSMLNCSETSLISDVGAALAKREGVDFALLWYYNGMTKCIHVSLRSDGRVDVQKIAANRHLNGGGHPCAAGFVWYDQNIELLFDYENPPATTSDTTTSTTSTTETFY